MIKQDSNYLQVFQGGLVFAALELTVSNELGELEEPALPPHQNAGIADGSTNPTIDVFREHSLELELGLPGLAEDVEAVVARRQKLFEVANGDRLLQDLPRALTSGLGARGNSGGGVAGGGLSLGPIDNVRGCRDSGFLDLNVLLA